MPVIINDLEIIVETSDTAPSEVGVASTAGGETDVLERTLTPRTLDQIDRHRRARAARIRGY